MLTAGVSFDIALSTLGQMLSHCAPSMTHWKYDDMLHSGRAEDFEMTTLRILGNRSASYWKLGPEHLCFSQEQHYCSCLSWGAILWEQEIVWDNQCENYNGILYLLWSCSSKLYNILLLTIHLQCGMARIVQFFPD